MIDGKHDRPFHRYIFSPENPVLFEVQLDPKRHIMSYQNVPRAHIDEFNAVFRDQNQLIANPDKICQIPQQAATIVIPPKPSKKVKISKRPSPEFWMPVSIDRVFWFSRGSENILANR